MSTEKHDSDINRSRGTILNSPEKTVFDTDFLNLHQNKNHGKKSWISMNEVSLESSCEVA